MEHKNMNATEKAILEQQYKKVWHKNAGMVKHCLKKASNYFVSDDGLIVIFEKPRIQTNFYFPEHGFDYDEANKTAMAASKSEKYFIDKNMSNLPSYRAVWDESENTVYSTPYIKQGVYSGQDSDCILAYICMGTLGGNGYYPHEQYRKEDGWRKLTEEEITRLKEAEERRNYLFEKRLRNYLKRYGLSKVSCSTYWADR